MAITMELARIDGRRIPDDLSDGPFLTAAYESIGVDGRNFPQNPKLTLLHFHASEILRWIGNPKITVASERKPKVRANKPKSIPKFYESYEWRRLRYEVIKDQGRQCKLCGRTPADGITINVDHIRPIKTHPALKLEKSNLQVLCHECNHGKANWDDTDWRE